MKYIFYLGIFMLVILLAIDGRELMIVVKKKKWELWFAEGWYMPSTVYLGFPGG